MSYTQRTRSLCEYVAEEWGDHLREALRLTGEYGVEHGFHVVGYPDDAYATQIRSGTEDSIDIVSHVTDAFRPIKVGVHTHPTGSIIPSKADWRSFITEYAQYRGSDGFPLGWGRGILIAAEPRWLDGEYLVRSIELTSAGADLSKDEQHDWTKNAWGAELNQNVEDVAADIGPQVATDTIQIPQTNVQ